MVFHYKRPYNHYKPSAIAGLYLTQQFWSAWETIKNGFCSVWFNKPPIEDESQTSIQDRARSN